MVSNPFKKQAFGSCFINNRNYSSQTPYSHSTLVVFGKKSRLKPNRHLATLSTSVLLKSPLKFDF